MGRLKRQNIAVRRANFGSAAESFLCLYSYWFFLSVLPCINLMGVVMGATTVALIASSILLRAPVSSRHVYSRKRNGHLFKAAELPKTGFANFIKLKPLGDY